MLRQAKRCARASSPLAHNGAGSLASFEAVPPRNGGAPGAGRQAWAPMKRFVPLAGR
jgi:hypothetical protein